MEEVVKFVGKYEFRNMNYDFNHFSKKQGDGMNMQTKTNSTQYPKMSHRVGMDGFTNNTMSHVM